MEIRTRAINSLLTRAMQPKSAEDMCGPDMNFANKMVLNNLFGLTYYGNRYKYAGQTHLQRSKRKKLLVMARLARKELTATSLFKGPPNS